MASTFTLGPRQAKSVDVALRASYAAFLTEKAHPLAMPGLSARTWLFSDVCKLPCLRGAAARHILPIIDAFLASVDAAERAA